MSYSEHLVDASACTYMFQMYPDTSQILFLRIKTQVTAFLIGKTPQSPLLENFVFQI